MFNLIPISIFIISLGGLIYIVSNHLSELSNDEPENGGFKEDRPFFDIRPKLANWISQLPIEGIKSRSLSVTQKFLHRTRILLLKADNGLMKIIGKIAEKGNGNKDGNGDDSETPTADFWDDFSKNKQENKVTLPICEPEVKIDLALKNETAKKFFDIRPAKKNSRVKKSAK